MRNVILIGFMGAGKSTLGKKLANAMDVAFIDADLSIEAQQGMSIGEIFAKHGEQYFRELEREFIHNLYSYHNPFVLATGGGMPCSQANMLSLRELGVTFYLHRSPKELAHRLKNAKSERPLIESMQAEELEDYIYGKLGEREEFYRKADFILDRNQQDVKSIRDVLAILHPNPSQRS